MKIEEVLNAIVARQHKIAVLNSLQEHLEEYVPTDISPEPEYEIFVEDPCLVPVVTQKAIEDVISVLTGLIEEEQKELNKLTSLETKPNGRTRKPSPRKSSTRKPSTKSAKPKPSGNKK